MLKTGDTILTEATNFDGGMTSDVRKKDARFSNRILGFDIFSFQGRLMPQLSMSADGFTSPYTVNNAKLCKFLSYGTSQSGTAQYALGCDNETVAQTNATIFKRASIPSGAWDLAGSNADTQWGFSERLFVEYKGKIYFCRDGSNATFVSGTDIAEYNIGTNTMNGTSLTKAFLTDNNEAAITQGLVHSKNVKLYVGYATSSGAWVAENNAGTWDNGGTGIKLVLPTNCIPTVLFEYGNLLGIATKPVSIGGKSRIFLWDMNAVSWNETIEWGSENLDVAEELNGYIVGVSSSPTTASIENPRIYFKVWGGSKVDTFAEFKTSASTAYFGGQQKKNNRVYFMMSVEMFGQTGRTAGIWSIGFTKSGNMAVAIERRWDNSTTFDGTDTAKGFQLLGDYLTIAYAVGGATYNCNRTTDLSTYAATSQFETIFLTGGDSSLKKDLEGVTVTFEPLIVNQVITLSYLTDEDTSFTQIFQNTASGNEISYSAVTGLPKDYKELRLMVGSSAGRAGITGISIKERVTGKRVYD